MLAGGGNELPEAGGVAARQGEGVIGAFDDRQQRQFERHVAFFQALDHVVHVEAAARARLFEERLVAEEPEALAFDARVGADRILELETVAHAVPDVVVGGVLAGLGMQPGGVELDVDGSGAGTCCFGLGLPLDLAAALAAGERTGDEQDGHPNGASQGV
ncbi:Uncharacterised protein [Pseudomonas aeruginosa]|nr:Uncharacterised protein [Pseudomonas aeruginosa]